MNRQKLFETITKKIISKLEQGTLPWEKEWADNIVGPFNFKTGRTYRGINYWSLSAYEFQSPAWLTFNQVKQLGLHVRKGSKSAPVLFWKLIEITDSESGEKKKIPIPRIYHVFNTEQVDGIEYSPKECPYELHKPSERIVAEYVDRPKIRTGHDSECYYSPTRDEVYMVSKSKFHSQEGYYATLFHELIHSTGHGKRLNRGLDAEAHTFGSNLYSKEELIAEMGAAHLCAIAGISKQTINNSAAYISAWLNVLKKDPSILITASQNAQLAADYILGNSFN